MFPGLWHRSISGSDHQYRNVTTIHPEDQVLHVINVAWQVYVSVMSNVGRVLKLCWEYGNPSRLLIRVRINLRAASKLSLPLLRQN